MVRTRLLAGEYMFKQVVCAGAVVASLAGCSGELPADAELPTDTASSTFEENWSSQHVSCAGDEQHLVRDRASTRSTTSTITSA